MRKKHSIHIICFMLVALMLCFNVQVFASTSAQITLSKTYDVLSAGGMDTLTANVSSTDTQNQSVTWKSSDSNIVVVINGTIVGMSPGNAVVTATLADGSTSASCSVTVNSNSGIPTTSLTLNKTSDNVAVGGKDTLVASILPSNATNQSVVWTSSNSQVATVSNGVVTGVTQGIAIITATSADGHSRAICNVFVSSGTVNITRLGGSDRYETSSIISKKGWMGTSNYAVLATGLDYPDALSATPLAKKYNAPILLTNKDSIPQSVLSEINRLNVKHVFIVGGTGVVSKAVEDQLSGMNIVVERFGGSDRYETSMKIADKLGVVSGSLMVANGYEWSSALSASSIAAKEGIPIILTDKDTMPSSVSKFMNENSFSKSYILGDTDLISNTVANQFPGSERIVGSNQYERNINILKKFESDINFSNICICTGKDFPDALSGSALAASVSSAIVLADGDNLQDITTQYVKAKMAQINNVYIFGGTGAVSDTTVKTLFPQQNN